jgi:hypothetical protein
MERYGNAMNPSGLSVILPQNEKVECENATPPILPRGGPEWDCLCDPIAGEVADFLDGRTHGESLFHTLYDHVLDEPVPERMREVLKR